MNEKGPTLDQLLSQREQLEKELHQHRAVITILFTDIVGSTAFYERFGDTAGVDMARRHERLCKETIAEFSGRIIKPIGDSVMAEFPDPESGVRCAMAIQLRLLRNNEEVAERDRFQLRMGLNHGPCFRRGDDVYGDAVNLAARIAHRAGPAQILVSSSIHGVLSPANELNMVSAGEEHFKGKEKKEQIFEVVWTEQQAYRTLRKQTLAAQQRGDLFPQDTSLDGLVQASPVAATTVVKPPSEPADSFVGSVLAGRYEIQVELGVGGMGVVYKAWDRETSETVALKRILPEYSRDPVLIERFRNELRLARKVTHRNVCRIYEFNRAGDLAFISMEYVEGDSLRSILSRLDGLPVRKGLAIARQLCEGLQEAHSQGIVHRDLKPENIMVDRAGTVKIMDFGIARICTGVTTGGTSGPVGTPAYMAPEQALSMKVDQRTDIYSLGLILYEIFTGTPAFTAEDPIALIFKNIQEPPRPPREIEPFLPEPIEAAILRSLEKKPENRFSSAADLEKALERPVRPEPPPPGPIEPRTPVVIQPPIVPPRRFLASWQLAIALGAVLTIGTVSAYLVKSRSDYTGATVVRENTQSRQDSGPLSPPPRDDRAILTEVETKFVNNRALREDDIRASCSNGVVMLEGTAKYRQDKGLAETLARSVGGVKDVISRIKIGTAATASDGPAGVSTQHWRWREQPVPAGGGGRAESGSNPTGESHVLQAPISEPKTVLQTGEGKSVAAISAQPTSAGPPPAQPVPSQVTIPAGTLVQLQLVDPISPDKATDGRAYRAVLSAPLSVDGRVVLAAGSLGGVRVAKIEKPGFLTPVYHTSLIVNMLADNNGSHQVQSDTQVIATQVNYIQNANPTVIGKFKIPTSTAMVSPIPAGTTLQFHLTAPLVVTLASRSR